MDRPPYILVAEDDPDDRFLLETAFKELKSPLKLSFVRDGVQLMNYLDAIDSENPLPDLIVLDLNMPLMSGNDCLLILKDHLRFGPIPVIIHSTSENETEKEDCMRNGAVHYQFKGTGFDQVRKSARFFYKFAGTANGNPAAAL